MSTRLTRAAIKVVESGQVAEDLPHRLIPGQQIALSYDLWEDRAAVWFLRRRLDSVLSEDVVTLIRTTQPTQWKLDGGMSSEAKLSLGPRTRLDELEELRGPWPEHISSSFAAGSESISDSLAGHFYFNAVVEADRLTFSDRGDRRIPNHGCCLVAYSLNQPPVMTVEFAGKRKSAVVQL